MNADNGGTVSLHPLDAGPPSFVVQSPFPQYAYGLLLAVREAVALGYRRLSSIELGVAGGNGLIELERLGAQLASTYGIEVDTVGFDLAGGMPPPADYRDSAYTWQSGFFKMDEPLLRSKLESAELLIGDIADTGREFIARSQAPIGFVSFDLDYYSSTRSALQALCWADHSSYLPRVLCYFDDTVGPHEELHSEFTGELLAIREFNDEPASRKIAKINGLHAKLHPLNEPWIEGMYVLHLFDHPDYNTYVFPQEDRQFPLET
jgi:hypothetical protein